MSCYENKRIQAGVCMILVGIIYDCGLRIRIEIKCKFAQLFTTRDMSSGFVSEKKVSLKKALDHVALFCIT